MLLLQRLKTWVRWKLRFGWDMYESVRFEHPDCVRGEPICSGCLIIETWVCRTTGKVRDVVYLRGRQDLR